MTLGEVFLWNKVIERVFTEGYNQTREFEVVWKMKLGRMKGRYWNMRQVSLDDIENNYKLEEYKQLYDKVLELISDNKIRPVKASGLNGKKPALYRKYWVVEVKKDYSEFADELLYEYLPIVSTEYYLKHLEQYEKDRKWLLLLNEYFKTNADKLITSIAMNERSFDIWHREKFLKEEQGKKILRRCHLDMEMLNIYETIEPLAYYAHTKETPQNVLIIENKDTFYSMRRYLLSGKNDILGIRIGTLIYGGGKGIHRSFQDIDVCGEPYMKQMDNIILYFGDVDYEGILIYEKFVELFSEQYQIKPFVEGYHKMLEKAYKIGIENLPETKEGQNQNIGNSFFDVFEGKERIQMQNILRSMKYIPQEILNVEDL